LYGRSLKLTYPKDKLAGVVWWY